MLDKVKDSVSEMKDIAKETVDNNSISAQAKKPAPVQASEAPTAKPDLMLKTSRQEHAQALEQAAEQVIHSQLNNVYR